MSVQVQGSGVSANLTTATLIPTVSTQTYFPSSYDGYSSVTVQGDSSLISSNIKSGVSIFGVTRSFISLSCYCGYFKDYTPSSQTTSVTLDVTRGIGVIVKILTVSFSVDESVVSPFIHGEVFGGLLWPSNIFGWANTISFYNNGIYKSGYGVSGNGIAISSQRYVTINLQQYDSITCFFKTALYHFGIVAQVA